MARALPLQSDFFHPAPERPRSDLSVVTLIQMECHLSLMKSRC
jgi:hypothetical protein